MEQDPPAGAESICPEADGFPVRDGRAGSAPVQDGLRAR